MPKKDTIVAGKATTYQAPDPAGGVKLETFIPWTLVKRGVKKQVITPLDTPEQFREEAIQEHQIRTVEQDSPVIKAMGLAHHWQRLLDQGKVASFADIAAAEGMDKGQVSRILRLALLAPEVTEACIAAEKPGIGLDRVLRDGISLVWEAQRKSFHPAT
jgi:hypothetical protein